MLETPGRAAARRGRVGVPVTPKANPGRKLFRSLTRKSNPATVEAMTDRDLLVVLLGERAACTVAARLASVGGLKGFHHLGEGGPHGLLMPGIDEANAARLLVLWEVAARITEPFRAAE